ncbi:MAG: hypothetical protein ACLQU1_14720 [Bryobacteraceae bacterium]
MLLALALWAAPVNAQIPGGIFYTSFGANNGGTSPPAAFSANYQCITGTLSSGSVCENNPSHEVAAPFRATLTNGLQSITLALGAGGGTNGVIVSLALDSGGTPGNILESWTVTNLPGGAQPALTTVNDRLNLVLTAAQPYWVIVQPMASDTYVVWYTNILGLGGAMANNGSGWYPLTGIIATQPAFSVNTSRTGALSHIAAGGGWTTVISLVNTSASQIELFVNFFADDGSPLSLTVTTTLEGQTQTYTAQQVPEFLNPNTTLLITMGGLTGSTAVGWAAVYSTGPVAGYAIFRQTPQSGSPSEGTVPLQTQSPYSILLPYDNTAGFVMGVALANLSPTPQTVTVAITDDSGNLLGTQTISIAANGHTSFVLPTQFPVTTGKLGIMQFRGNGSLSGLGLRFSPFGTFTSVPTTIAAPASQ